MEVCMFTCVLLVTGDGLSGSVHAR